MIKLKYNIKFDLFIFAIFLPCVY